MQRRRLIWIVVPGLLVLVWVAARPAAGQSQQPAYTVDVPAPLLHSVPAEVEVTALGEPQDGVELEIGGRRYPVEFADGSATVGDVVVRGGSEASVRLLADGEPVAFRDAAAEEVARRTTATTMPGWLSLLPPIIAIGVALAFRQVIPALVLGVWVGAWLTYGLSVPGVWLGLLDVLNVWIVEALVPPDGDASHISIVVFTMMIGGMVGIIARNGGTRGIVDVLTRWARNRRRGQLATSVLGLVIFFDDYANTLIIGNAMRPVTDRLHTSREKLSYIVDSTAAPVASLALVSTWIGFEVGLISEAINQIGLDQTGYAVFLQSLAYRFYPILAILLVFAIAWTGRDFGPMYAAELRAIEDGTVARPDAEIDTTSEDEFEPSDQIPYRLANAAIPILVLVGVALGALFITGEGSTIANIVGSADAYGSLMWGSLMGVLVAAALSLAQRLLSLREVVDAWYAGVKSVLFVLIILTLAWALAGLTEALHTAEYLASALGEALPPWSVPALLFLVAGATSFATGTSWGTMGILMPLAVPLTWAILQANDLAGPAGLPIFYASVSTILAGAVWGDHCSPISDTTVLSSLATQCDHIDHVRTQIPYALVAGGVSVLLGLLPVGLGASWWIAMLASTAALLAGLTVFGRDAEAGADVGTEAELAKT